MAATSRVVCSFLSSEEVPDSAWHVCLCFGPRWPGTSCYPGKACNVCGHVRCLYSSLKLHSASYVTSYHNVTHANMTFLLQCCYAPFRLNFTMQNTECLKTAKTAFPTLIRIEHLIIACMIALSLYAVCQCYGRHRDSHGPKAGQEGGVPWTGSLQLRAV